MLLSSDDGSLVTKPRSFLHHQYLWIWMRAGLIGLVSLIALLALGISNGARWCRARHGKDDAWLGAGIIASLVAVAASSNVAIFLSPPDSTVPLVGVLALGAVAGPRPRRRGSCITDPGASAIDRRAAASHVP